MRTDTFPLLAPDGRSLVVAVAKVTLRRTPSGELVPHDEPRRPRLVDEHYDADADWPVLKRPSDVGPEKAGADVLVLGSALSKAPVAFVDVVLYLGGAVVPLRVHGERLYYQGVGGLAVSEAAPFEDKELRYDYCYGGATADLQVIDWRNPAGRGVCHRAADLVERPAPLIEHVEHPITGAGSDHDPICFGAIAASWKPRVDHFGTADERWQQERMPMAPEDYDVRAANLAHPSCQVSQLTPGMSLAVTGMNLDTETWSVALPTLTPQVNARRDDGSDELLWAVLDTVLLEPNDDLVELTYRAHIVHGRGKRRLREVSLVH